MVQYVYKYAASCRLSAAPLSRLVCFKTGRQRLYKRNIYSRRQNATKRDFQAVFVSTEVAPWSKAGGLGDVLDALPVALARRGLPVMTVAPAYEAYPDTNDCGISIPVDVTPYDSSEGLDSELVEGQSLHSVQIRIRVSKGVLRAFVAHPFFSVPGADIYSAYTAEGEARDVPAAMDVLCQAAIAASCLLWHNPALLTGWVGGPLVTDSQLDKRTLLAMLPQTIFVANDWPTGLLPLQLLAWQRKQSVILGFNASQMQQAASPSLALVPTAAGGKHLAAGSSQLAGTAKLAVFHRLNQLSEATPEDPLWQDARCILQEMLQESLVDAKAVMCIHNIAYQGVFSGQSAESHNLPPYLLDYLDPFIEELPPLPDLPGTGTDQSQDQFMKVTTVPSHNAHGAADTETTHAMHENAWQEVQTALKQRAAEDIAVPANHKAASPPRVHPPLSTTDTERRRALIGAVSSARSPNTGSSKHHSRGLAGREGSFGGLEGEGGEEESGVLVLSRTEAMLWRRWWRKGRTPASCNPQIRTVSLSALALVSWHALLGPQNRSEPILLQPGLLATDPACSHSIQHTGENKISQDGFDSDDYSESEEETSEGPLWHSTKVGTHSCRCGDAQRHRTNQSSASPHVRGGAGVGTCGSSGASDYQVDTAVPGVDNSTARALQGGAAVRAELRSHALQQHVQVQHQSHNGSTAPQQGLDTGARDVSSDCSAQDADVLHAATHTDPSPEVKQAGGIAAAERSSRALDAFNIQGMASRSNHWEHVGATESTQSLNGIEVGDKHAAASATAPESSGTSPEQATKQQVVSSHPLPSHREILGKHVAKDPHSINRDTLQQHCSQHAQQAVDVSGHSAEMAAITERGLAGNHASQQHPSEYLGKTPIEAWEALCPAELDSGLPEQKNKPRQNDPVRNVVNWLLGGLRSAAALVTVSPAYAREIQTDSEQAMGLLPALSGKRVYGIINGINTNTWNPTSDPLLAPPMRYTPTTCAKGKAAAKLWLQGRLDLPQDAGVPLVAFVGRLTEQKGVDVLLKALYASAGPEGLAASSLARSLANQGGGKQHKAQQAQRRPMRASQRDFQTVIMGTGDNHLENELRYLSRTLPGRAAGSVGFDERFAHRMLAAADILVVPSRFEPCGLVALAALRYGAVPVVASTGGLRDIVTGRFLIGTTPSVGGLEEALPVPKKPVAHAFGFEAGEIAISTEAADTEASVQRLHAALLRAVAEVGTPRFRRMQQAGMNADVSWAAPAASWHEMLLDTAHGDDANSLMDE